MFDLKKYLIMGCIGFAITVITLYAILSEEDRTNPLDPLYVEQCRSLARESMNLSVEAAQAKLDVANPVDAPIIEDFQKKADELQLEFDKLGCSKNAERWAYGSFKQEMVELERYIADLVREEKNPEN